MEPRKKSLSERLAEDPELREAMEGTEERMIERIKQGHRERLQREAREVARREREKRRRARLRRLTFGLLGRS
ncbi:MAG: hypothetical protein HY511_00180 [Actinobacteria bacterium]|nr:hypothetical protein [Actinomycetota bacterium]